MNIFSFYNSQNLTAIYDYCSLEDSYVASRIINDVKSHYNQYFDERSNNCVFLQEKFFNYDKQFSDLYLKSGHLNVRCPRCTKIFKNKEMLLMHTKLFHNNYDQDLEDIKVCPADLCQFLDCSRYSGYFDRVKVNVQEREIVCDKNLEKFYRRGCLSLFKNCLKNDEESIEKNTEATFDYYQNFCKKIECLGEGIETSQVSKPSGLLDVLKLLGMYLFGIFSLIYLLIVWVSHYQ